MGSDICYNLAMRKSTRLLNQFYEERFSALGIKGGQFSILRAVHFLKETTNSELQGILTLDQTTLSRNLKPLLRDGFLVLNADAGDQRIKRISLTAEGQQLYKAALPMWKAAQSDLEKRLGKQNTQQLLAVSSTLVKLLSEP